MILSSSLIAYYFKKSTDRQDLVFPEIKIHELSSLPINIPSNISAFSAKADQMLSLNKDLQETSQRFQRTLQRKFELAELPGKLQEWYQLSYADFIKELGKKKIKLSLAQEAEWEEYFVQESKRAQELKSKIEATDKAIDQMVYELYGLTAEEIGIVER